MLLFVFTTRFERPLLRETEGERGIMKSRFQTTMLQAVLCEALREDGIELDFSAAGPMLW